MGAKSKNNMDLAKNFIQLIIQDLPKGGFLSKIRANMACELFDYLKTLGFSNEKACVYEANCQYAKDRGINLIEVAESCKAAADEQSETSMTDQDLFQESEIKALISISRVN